MRLGSALTCRALLIKKDKRPDKDAVSAFRPFFQQHAALGMLLFRYLGQSWEISCPAGLLYSGVPCCLAVGDNIKLPPDSL